MTLTFTVDQYIEKHTSKTRDAYVRIQMETIKMCGPPLQAMFPDKADYDRRLIAAQKRFRKKMELEELRKKDD